MTQTAPTAPSSAGYNPLDPDVQRDPYPHYRWLLENDRLHRGGMDMLFVSGYEDVRAVLGDSRFVRGPIRDHWAQLTGAGPLADTVRESVLFQDEPDHSRLRGLIGPAFAPREVRALTTRIDTIAADLVAAVEPHGRIDVINDFAYPLALTVISEVLGLPVEDVDRFRAWSLAIGPTLDLAASPDEIATGQVAVAELVEHVRALGDGCPGGLLEVMQSARRSGSISETEILAMVITLVFAGHETVTNQIGNSILALANHPDQIELLARTPALVENAVEECLRYDSSVQSNSRLAVADVDLGGGQVHPGDVVVLLLGAANRDQEVFVAPDTFDVRRSGTRPMSFGSGIRFCVGAILARIELTAALRTLGQLPGLAVAVPDSQLEYQRSTMFRGLTSLPMTFTARP